MIKSLAKNLVFLPHMFFLRVKGIEFKSAEDYKNYVTFFRFFPTQFNAIDPDGLTTLNINGKKIVMDCSKIHPMNLSEVFSRGVYSQLNFKGKDVIDIGTALGDSLVYFGVFGAKSVRGYEINKRYFDTCKKNIELNHLDNCSVEFCGIGKTEPAKFEGLHAVMPPEDIEKLGSVPMKSLDEVSQGIEHGLLKIDVDGYEYEIFDGLTKHSFDNFDEVFMEYHYGVRDLAQKLVMAGFKVEIQPVKKNAYVDYHPEGWKQMDEGFIWARR